MYRTVICATLSALCGCAEPMLDDDDFARRSHPLRLAAELTGNDADAVGKVADQSANAADATQSDGECEVVLSIDVATSQADADGEGGAAFITLGDSQAVRGTLRVWAQNRSPRVQRFRYLSPGCPAPALLLGLPEGYDAYGVCALPACVRDPEALTEGARVILRPGQRIPLGRALVSTEPTECNAEGLARGRYLLRASLGEVDGARVCTRKPFALEVR